MKLPLKGLRGLAEPLAAGESVALKVQMNEPTANLARALKNVHCTDCEPECKPMK